jgi:N-acetylmuramoyl-L-alanine amidase
MAWLSTPAPVVDTADPAEFRGAWVSRFEWASTDPDRCKANITQIFKTLADANFNAAVFQIRGAAETLYPSEFEPWSPLLGGQDPGFDPVALAIEEAHRGRIAFHAYINPMPLRALRWPDAPQDANHLFYRHGPNAPESWVCVDRQGRVAKREYYYLSAGVPGVHAYLRKVIMDVVRRYEVDGIHLDRIRYPGREYSHDPISRRRFLGRGNPTRLDWADWQRKQLDKLINDLVAEIRAEKPQVVISCAAWGIYNRHHIDGYGEFSSGYHDYYQDTWNWCRLGAMDVLMPMIYWNLDDPKPNYDELLEDFVQGVGADRFVGGQRVFSPEENVRQIRLTREAGAMGTVLWNFRSAQRRGVIERLAGELYQDKAPVPVVARMKHGELGTVLGTVVAEDGKPLVDAWVSLRPIGGDGPRNRVFRQTWTTSADGRFAFLNVPPGSVEVVVNYEGAPEVRSDVVRVRAGGASRAHITAEGVAELRDKPYLAILRPRDGLRTSGQVVHILGRTQPGNRVTIGEEELAVYATGGFARDNFPLEPGENRLEIKVADRRQSLTRVITVNRIEPQPETPVSALKILQPAEDLAVKPGQGVNIKIEGPPGRSGRATLFDGQLQLPLVETPGGGGQSTGTYTAAMRAPRSATGKSTRVHVTLDGSDHAGPLEDESAGSVEVWSPAEIRIAETTGERTGITYGLHSVRLGGPWLARVPKGTRFEVIGRQGDKCHVRLSASMTGWVSQRRVRMLPPGTEMPHNHFASCHVGGDDDHDTLSIGMSAPTVVAVRSEIDPSNRLYLDFFNTHDAMTWISHKSGAQIIGTVRAEQIEEDWLRLTVPLKCKQIWGYWTEATDGRFVLYVRRPPKIAPFPDSPLRGLKIALEAGHGGSGSGAVGNFGTKEKTVNMKAARVLQSELEARGARVVQVRRGDESPSLSERVARTNEAGADLFVSIHANAAGTSRGFLRVSGTSTYYHDIHCRLPAELVYEKLLRLGWDEFGVVGNFSYRPLRNTRVPGILIEQAFMSHPGDEARLLDPEYRRQQAVAIADGLEAFCDRARE